MSKNLDKNRILYIIMPIILSVVVFISFAIAGNITKNRDEKNPTATTEVSLVNEETTTKTPLLTSKVTLTAVGDNLIHNTIISSGQQDDGTLDYTSLYSGIKPVIEKSDISIINQETILGGSSFEYSGYPLFNSPWEIGEAAIDAGFDIFTCATNHSLDMGYKGIESENQFFNKHKEVVSLGVNGNSDDYENITYYEKNGIIFALFNYTYGTNGISLPEDKPWCVNLMDKDKITKDLTQARKNADVVVVFPHWGTEYSLEVSSYQKEYVKLFNELGADIVIGSHPHVIEPVEWITNDKTGHKTLVYYSLGNFISHQINLDNLVGGIAQITINKKGEEVEISSAQFVPIVTHYEKNSKGDYEFNVYKLSDYSDEMAQNHSQSDMSVEYCTDLVKSVIDDEFLKLD